ncbi:MAG TPA: hypothetical protein VKZ43_06940 [Trueperaceae bacterium]|nr:hypothetical protein [Trueperaceae bacterium]
MLHRLAVLAILVALASAVTVTAAQGLAGTFEGQSDAGPVQAEFAVAGGRVTGTLVGPGLTFRFEGTLSGIDAYGTVHTAQGTASFEAYLAGDTLGLYLYEVDAAGAPVPESVVELLLTRRGGVATQPVPLSPVVATGAHATLTQDDATAFVEALEFVLAQIGYTYQFTQADRARLVTGLAENFPAADPMDQLVLADASIIWERVKSNWPVASEADRREFALGVLILAFGEETVSSWVGPLSGGGGQSLGAGGQCATFDDCSSSFIDEKTWTDTFNSQGCWAAAGCGGFDASTNSFDYGDY